MDFGIVSWHSLTFFFRPAAFSYEDCKSNEQNYQQNFNHQILNAFSQLHVNLFRYYHYRYTCFQLVVCLRSCVSEMFLCNVRLLPQRRHGVHQSRAKILQQGAVSGIHGHWRQAILRKGTTFAVVRCPTTPLPLVSFLSLQKWIIANVFPLCTVGLEQKYLDRWCRQICSTTSWRRDLRRSKICGQLWRRKRDRTAETRLLRMTGGVTWFAIPLARFWLLPYDCSLVSLCLYSRVSFVWLTLRVAVSISKAWSEWKKMNQDRCVQKMCLRASGWRRGGCIAIPAVLCRLPHPSSRRPHPSVTWHTCNFPCSTTTCIMSSTTSARRNSQMPCKWAAMCLKRRSPLCLSAFLRNSTGVDNS